MRRVVICSIALAAAFAVPANAKPPKPGKAEDCTAHKVGYHASGTLVSHTLSQTKGADTARRGDDRYSGTLTVDVKKANHRAPKGAQTYTVQDARVRFHTHGAAPKAGDRVKISGKTTKLRKQCDASGFTAATTVRKIDFKAAKATAKAKAPKGSRHGSRGRH